MPARGDRPTMGLMRGPAYRGQPISMTRGVVDSDGGGDGPTPPTGDLRVTDGGDYRVTSAGDNRSVVL